MADAKVAIVLQAGVNGHEQLARALHSVLYTKELQEKGRDVRLVFDGAGTEWLARWHDANEGPEAQLAGLFRGLKEAGLTYEVCDYCSGAFQVKEKLQEAGEPLVGEYMDHPSLATLVDDGYQVWII